MVALLVCSIFFQFIAAYLSFRFVLHKRLGAPWILVSTALLVTGVLRVLSLAVYFEDPAFASLDRSILVVEFAVSFLLGIGFLLTERWYLLRERLEGRFRQISEVDQALVGVLDEERILSIVCEGLAGRNGYQLAWIGTAETDGSISVVKAAGECRDFLKEVWLRWDDSPEGICPPGTAVRSGEMCVVNRVDIDPRAEHWKNAAGRYGIRSFASVRIDVKRSSAMVLSIGSGRQNAFDRLEMEGVAAMARRVGTALFSARRHELFACAKKSYGDLFQFQRDGVILVRGGTIVRANPAAVAMLGYSSAEELQGSDPAILFPDADAPSVSPILQPQAEKSDWVTISKMRRRDGTLFTGEVTATWVPRAGRHERSESWDQIYEGPLGTFLFRDISSRMQTLEELRKERDFSARVLDVAEMLVVQFGPGGEILLFNRQCELVTGYSASEVTGRKITDFLLPGSSRDIHARAFEDILEGQFLRGLEYALLSKSGDERTIVWDFEAIREPDGRVGSVFAVGSDITERRRLERAILTMQKMEAVGTLAGGVAHDFNNILTGILGNLDLARKLLPPASKAASLIEESIQASERAARLTRQLLEFSRRTALERRATDLGKVVREVVQLFSQTIDRRIGVVESVEDGLWPAQVDSNQVHQVLMNLCVNARDAVIERMDGGKAPTRDPDRKAIRICAGNVTIGEEYCRIYSYARPGEFVVLSIADNGIGMDEVTQRRVFEPFFTTKRLGRGTGLGLSTVYGIVKQHEGWITLDSEPGAGTTFRCYFPRSAESPEEAPAAAEADRSWKGRETILLVDDEEMIRELGSQILQLQGYKVITAQDGEEAVEIFLSRRQEIALVVLDLTMPHMSGLEVLDRIREIDPAAKVILSSGYRADESHNTERLSEASAFLPKPYRADVLTRIVRDVLDGVTA